MHHLAVGPWNPRGARSAPYLAQSGVKWQVIHAVAENGCAESSRMCQISNLFDMRLKSTRWRGRHPMPRLGPEKRAFAFFLVWADTSEQLRG